MTIKNGLIELKLVIFGMTMPPDAFTFSVVAMDPDFSREMKISVFGLIEK